LKFETATSRQNTNEALVGGEATLGLRAATALAAGASRVGAVVAPEIVWSATMVAIWERAGDAHVLISQVPESLLRRIHFAYIVVFRYHVGFV